MKRIVVITGLMILAAIVVVGVFLGINWLGPDTVAAQEAPAQPVMVIAVEEVKNGERIGGEVRVTFTDPPELPTRAVDAAGLFVNKDGQALTLGTGLIDIAIDVEAVNDQEPVSKVDASYDGAEVQLLVDEDTVYYKDVTSRPEMTSEIISAGKLEVTRVLERGTLAEIGENMEIRAWGHEVDGQLLADLVVYDPID